MGRKADFKAYVRFYNIHPLQAWLMKASEAVRYVNRPYGEDVYYIEARGAEVGHSLNDTVAVRDWFKRKGFNPRELAVSYFKSHRPTAFEVLRDLEVEGRLTADQAHAALRENGLLND